MEDEVISASVKVTLPAPLDETIGAAELDALGRGLS